MERRKKMRQIKATYVDHMGSDLSVVNAARVSFGKKSAWANQGDVDENYYGPDSAVKPKLSDRDTKLIKYLAKHEHFSPFGHAFASFHVKAPIFVARQLVKHKFLRWNEISRRYVDDEPDFYVPDVWRGRSADKKQGSEGEVLGVWDLEVSTGAVSWDEYDPTIEDVTTCPMNFMEAQMQFYKQLVDEGVAPEQARMVLPQSTMTEWYWSGSLDAFANMCILRLKSDTQYESRLVAQQISEKMAELFPVSWKALVGEGEVQ
jgi:thymidylate synthase (FAD)